LSLKLDHTVTFDGESIHVPNIKALHQSKLDQVIRNVIPFGMEVNKTPYYNMERNFPWAMANAMNLRFVHKFKQRFGISITPTVYDYKWFVNKCKSIRMNLSRAECSLGTLGGGR